jgi:hypothetical protein
MKSKGTTTTEDITRKNRDIKSFKKSQLKEDEKENKHK